MYRCRICDVPDEDGFCAPCEDLERRLNTLISCEPERAALYLEYKLNIVTEQIKRNVEADVF